jgi:hypothetical protein
MGGMRRASNQALRNAAASAGTTCPCGRPASISLSSSGEDKLSSLTGRGALENLEGCGESRPMTLLAAGYLTARTARHRRGSHPPKSRVKANSGWLSLVDSVAMTVTRELEESGITVSAVVRVRLLSPRHRLDAVLSMGFEARNNRFCRVRGTTVVARDTAGTSNGEDKSTKKVTPSSLSWRSPHAARDRGRENSSTVTGILPYT